MKISAAFRPACLGLAAALACAAQAQGLPPDAALPPLTGLARRRTAWAIPWPA